VAWEVAAGLVFLFALWVAYELSAGHLDTLGSPYYGVAVSWRTDVLLLLLAAVQALCVADAIVLAWRRRSWIFWMALFVAVLVLPLGLLLSMAQIDLWRHDLRAAWANVIAGALMAGLIAATYALRRWAWRRT